MKNEDQPSKPTYVVATVWQMQKKESLSSILHQHAIEDANSSTEALGMAMQKARESNGADHVKGYSLGLWMVTELPAAS